MTMLNATNFELIDVAYTSNGYVIGYTSAFNEYLLVANLNGTYNFLPVD